jgi:two-component system response regulator HydG
MALNAYDPDMNLLWQEIVGTMSEGLVVIGPDGRIRLVNRAMSRLTGYGEQEMVGRLCTIFNCDACEIVRDAGQDQGQWCRLFDPKHGGVESRRCQLMHKSGNYQTVLKNASPLVDDNGQVVGVVETLTDISELEKRERKIEELHRRLNGGDGFQGMVGRSAPMRKVFDLISRAAQSDGPIILYGESGTGKELAARAIHDLRDEEAPFIQLNCAALNEALLESELFGHVKGAFTGAYRHRKGRFEAAHGGDIFLDEIGDMPASIQVKLLRVLENKHIERVGDHRPVSVDVRVIAATHRDLNELVASQRFREDLFFRINVIPIYLPPLRERTDDIPILIDHFLGILSRTHGRSIKGLSGRAMDFLMKYSWPGNVRELKGALEYAWIIAGDTIHPEHLPQNIQQPQVRGVPVSVAPLGGDGDRQAALENALRQARGNQSEAARILGVSRVTIWNWIRKYGVDVSDFT